MPTQPSPVFNIISRTQDACGTGTLEFLVQRLLNTNGVQGSDVSYNIVPGVNIDMIVAGVETMAMTSDYGKTPSHTEGRGFEGTLNFIIEADGTIKTSSSSNFWLIHGLILGISWTVLALI